MIAVSEEDVVRIKAWIVRAAKLRAQEIGKEAYTHRQYRDQIVREYYGIKSYRELCGYLKDGMSPVRIKAAKTGGIYDLRTLQGETQTFQDILNLIGPYCKNETIQEKLARKMEEIGLQQFEGMANLRPRTAAWRIGRDVLDRVFILLFNFPHGQRIKMSDHSCARLNLDVKNGIVTGMEVSRM